MKKSNFTVAVFYSLMSVSHMDISLFTVNQYQTFFNTVQYNEVQDRASGYPAAVLYEKV